MYRFTTQRPVEFLEVGIFIVLSEEIQALAKDLFLEISKCLGNTGNNTANTFHISLFQIRVERATLEQLSKDVQFLAEQLVSFEVNLYSQLEDTQENIFWNANNNNAFQALHKQVLEIALPYRRGLMQQYQEVYENSHTTLADKEKLAKTGILGACEDYKPHITLYYGSGKNPIATSLCEKITISQQCHFKIAQLGIGRLGYEGNVAEIIKIFELPSSKPSLVSLKF